MERSHRSRVEALLRDAATQYAELIPGLPPDVQESLPVDAHGPTQADAVGGAPLGREVRSLLVAHPPPVGAEGEEVVATLRAAYGAQERAAVAIAAGLDATERRPVARRGAHVMPGCLRFGG